MSNSQSQKYWIGVVCLTVFTIISFGCIAAPEDTATPTPEPTAFPTATINPIDESEPDQSGPVILNIWLPPQFDPANDSQASALLNARLEEFTTRRSDVSIQIRIKDVEGPGGIENTLETAQAAAPLALPDLVALPNETLQSAASKGLLHSFDDLTDTMEDPDWFDFARKLSHSQNSIFGIPFAGDAQIMVYRPEVVEEPPTDWATTLELETPLSFPAADPVSLLTLTLYQAAGGTATDEEGASILEMTPLTDVFNFYYQANQNEVIPFWLTQYETDDQSWVAYEEGQANLAITWLSRFLQMMPADSALTTLPTPDGIPYTTATGWAWALVTSDPERQVLIAELVEFLTNSEYMAQWAFAAGYLPPRPSAIIIWENAPFHGMLLQIGSSAHLAPSSEVILTLGPILSKNAVDVLKEQTDPATAAQNAIEALTAP